MDSAAHFWELVAMLAAVAVVAIGIGYGVGSTLEDD